MCGYTSRPWAVTLSWQHMTYKLGKLGQSDLVFGLSLAFIRRSVHSALQVPVLQLWLTTTWLLHRHSGYHTDTHTYIQRNLSTVITHSITYSYSLLHSCKYNRRHCPRCWSHTREHKVNIQHYGKSYGNQRTATKVKIFNCTVVVVDQRLVETLEWLDRLRQLVQWDVTVLELHATSITGHRQRRHNPPSCFRRVCATSWRLYEHQHHTLLFPSKRTSVVDWL